MTTPAIPPSDPSTGVAINVATADYVGNFSALWVGTTGAIAVTGLDGVAVTFPGVPVGWFKFHGKSVLHTGTTASGLVACN